MPQRINFENGEISITGVSPNLKKQLYAICADECSNVGDFLKKEIRRIVDRRQGELTPGKASNSADGLRRPPMKLRGTYIPD